MSEASPEGRRARQARATRAEIVTAAARLFLRDGYNATTIAAIADEAGVAVQTVYNAVGPKSALLAAVLDTVAAGPGAPKSVPEFMRDRTESAVTAHDVVAVLADWFAEVHPRMHATTRTVAEAAAVDAQVALDEDERAAQRLANYGRAADTIASRPGAAAINREEAAALIWSVGHAAVYARLVDAQGWPVARYRDWVQGTLARGLLA